MVRSTHQEDSTDDEYGLEADIVFKTKPLCGTR